MLYNVSFVSRAQLLYVTHQCFHHFRIPTDELLQRKDKLPVREDKTFKIYAEPAGELKGGYRREREGKKGRGDEGEKGREGRGRTSCISH